MHSNVTVIFAAVGGQQKKSLFTICWVLCFLSLCFLSTSTHILNEATNKQFTEEITCRMLMKVVFMQCYLERMQCKLVQLSCISRNTHSVMQDSKGLFLQEESSTMRRPVSAHSPAPVRTSNLTLTYSALHWFEWKWDWESSAKIKAFPSALVNEQNKPLSPLNTPEPKQTTNRTWPQPCSCQLDKRLSKRFDEQRFSDADSWTQTYFQCGSRKGYRRHSETGAALWSCICTQTGGVEPPLSSKLPRRCRRHCCKILASWQKLLSTNERRQPGSPLWAPPCFCITADVALSPRAWRDACWANRAFSHWTMFGSYFVPPLPLCAISTQPTKVNDNMNNQRRI